MPDLGLSKDSLRNIVSLTGEFVGTTDTQILTNKEYNTTDNSLTATSQAAGDILKSNATKFVRLARGTAGQPLKVNAGGTDLDYGTLPVIGGGTGVATLAAGVVIANGTSAFTQKANPTGAFLGDSDTQNVTGAKTFTNQTFIQRNPAGTFSLTWVHPAITAAKERRAYQPYNYLVYPEGGIWYVKNGLNEAIDNSSATATTMIQWAMDNLTAARTQKEVVKIIGSPSVTTLTIPSYTVLDLTAAKISQANSANVNMLINNDTSGGNTQIEVFGGIIDGNKAGQSIQSGYTTANILSLVKCTNSSIHDSYLVNSNSSGVYLEDCTNLVMTRTSVVDPRKCSMKHHGTSAGSGKYTWVTDNYFSNATENFVGMDAVTDQFIERNQMDTSATNGINTNGARNHIRYNYVTGCTSSGIVVSTEGTYHSDDSSIIGNEVYECKTGGINCGVSFPSARIKIMFNKCKGATSGQNTAAYGIRLAYTTNSIISGNESWNWQAAGLTVEGNTNNVAGISAVTNIVQCSNNICWDNGQNTGGSNQGRVGISLIGNVAASVKRVNVFGNICYDSAPGKQNQGLRYTMTTDTVIKNNDFRGNVLSGISDIATNTTPTIRNNLGYVTENSGSSTQSGDGTNKVYNIAHGLIAAPTKYIVQSGSADAIGPPYLTADATNLIVTYPTAPPTGSSNLVLRWLAEVV